MIVSHQHQYIFFAVPKTATHAIREALRANKGVGDWEQQMLFGKQEIPIPNIAKIGHGHITVTEIQPLLDAQQWSNYYKFAFIRNPFDRFVSACAFLNRGNLQFKEHPTQWMKAAMTRPQFRQRILIRPQSEQLCDESGDIAMDYIGRYEELQSSLDHILDHLNCPRVNLKSRNASDHAHFRDYYDDELKQAVSSFYQKDCELFGYWF